LLREERDDPAPALELEQRQVLLQVVALPAANHPVRVAVHVLGPRALGDDMVHGLEQGAGLLDALLRLDAAVEALPLQLRRPLAERQDELGQDHAPNLVPYIW